MHSEKFRFEVKDEGDFVSEEETKFVNGKRALAISSFSRQEMCLGILTEFWVDGKTLQASCVELTYFTTVEILVAIANDFDDLILILGGKYFLAVINGNAAFKR